jgi:hypothetical protein
MRISHETIYRSLYVQSRGELRRQLTANLRTGRSTRRSRRDGDAHRGRVGRHHRGRVRRRGDVRRDRAGIRLDRGDEPAAQEIAGSAQSLAGTAQQLQGLVAQFTLADA